MPFYEKLRMLIDERELTQKQIAHELHIPASTLGGYVQGTSEPDFDTLKLFASYFKVSSDYLLDIQDNKTENAKEDELLRVFRALSAEQQELYIEQGKTLLRFNAKKTKKSSTSTLRDNAV